MTEQTRDPRASQQQKTLKYPWVRGKMWSVKIWSTICQWLSVSLLSDRPLYVVCVLDSLSQQGNRTSDSCLMLDYVCVINFRIIIIIIILLLSFARYSPISLTYNTTIHSKHVKVKRKLLNCRQVTLSSPPPRSNSLQTLPRLIVTINRVNYFNRD